MASDPRDPKGPSKETELPEIEERDLEIPEEDADDLKGGVKKCGGKRKVSPLGQLPIEPPT